MRIAFLTTEYPTEANFAGGLASYLRRTARVLSQMGHDVEVFTSSTSTGRIDDDGVLVHRVPAGSKLEGGVRKLRVFSRYHGISRIFGRAWNLDQALKRRHREEPFQVAQAASCMACGVVAALRPAVPLVTRISSYVPAWRSAETEELTETDRHNAWAQVLQMRRSAAVYAPSRVIADMISINEAVNAEVVEPPFDMEYLEHLSLDCPPGEVSEGYGLYFGALKRMKGCDRLVQVLPELLKRNPEFRFVFVGNVLNNSKGELLAKELQLLADEFGERVRIVGAQRHEELFRYVAHARFVVLPSRIDNLPNTCLEAMALRRPVIGTLRASFDQLIDHGRNGFLVSQHDDAELIAQMEFAWKLDPPTRRELGMAASVTIERLAPVRTTATLVELFERVSREHSSRPVDRERQAEDIPTAPTEVAVSR